MVLVTVTVTVVFPTDFLRHKCDVITVTVNLTIIAQPVFPGNNL